MFFFLFLKDHPYFYTHKNSGDSSKRSNSVFGSSASDSADSSKTGAFSLTTSVVIAACLAVVGVLCAAIFIVRRKNENKGQPLLQNNDHITYTNL